MCVLKWKWYLLNFPEASVFCEEKQDSQKAELQSASSGIAEAF